MKQAELGIITILLVFVVVVFVVVGIIVWRIAKQQEDVGTVNVKRIGPILSTLIGGLVFGTGLAAFVIAAFAIGYWIEIPLFLPAAILVASLSWTILYVIAGLEIVGPKDFVVVERMGLFHRVLKPGWRVLCMPGIIDRIVNPDGIRSLKVRELVLYSDPEDKENKLDFACGATAAVKAILYYRVVDPIAFTYSSDNVLSRMEEIMDSITRRILQSDTIDAASKNLKSISASIAADKDTMNALIEMGVEMVNYVITDIILPEDVIANREKVLAAEKDAEAQEKIGHGYMRAIEAMMECMEKKGLKYNFEKALDFYLEMQRMKTLRETKSNVTLIGHNIREVGMLIGTGNKGSQNPREEKGGE